MTTRKRIEENERALKRLCKALAREKYPQERANLKIQIERTRRELADRKRSQLS